MMRRLVACGPAVLLVICFFLPFFGVQTGWACDDTVLMLVSGANPGDEFSGALLKMAQNLREMASALNAFNIESAQQLLNKVLGSWVSFDNRYSQNPPFRWKGDSRWTARVKQLTDLMGVVRGHFQGGRYKPAHDMLEGIVIQMTLLSTGAVGAKDFEPVLEAEWLMNSLNPSLPGVERMGLIAGLSSFSVAISELKSSLSSGTNVVLDELASRTGSLQKELTTAQQVGTPMQMRFFADLLAGFAKLKGMLWQRPNP